MFPPPATPRSEQSGLWQNWVRGSMRVLQMTECDGCVTLGCPMDPFCVNPHPAPLAHPRLDGALPRVPIPIVTPIYRDRQQKTRGGTARATITVSLVCHARG